VIAAHTAGRLQEAEAGYRDILRSEPRHFLALNNLGMIALVSGQYKAAVELVDAALAIAPDDARLAPSHRAMGMTLYTQGYWKDAARGLKRARRLAPDDAEVAAACARIAPAPDPAGPSRIAA
jgi:Flp pilus assembly protein TadD